MALLKRHCWTYILSLLLLAGFIPTAHAAELQLQEQEIKAGLLYNFLKYTDWPAGKMSGNAIVVCIIGDDPFGGYLQPMAGRSVNQHEIAIRTLHSANDAGDCHLLFVNAIERERWPQIRSALAGKSVLTVSDFESFAENGGMIEFGHKNNHISAELNMDALIAAHLHVQDRMLKLVSIAHASSPEAK